LLLCGLLHQAFLLLPLCALLLRVTLYREKRRINHVVDVVLITFDALLALVVVMNTMVVGVHNDKFIVHKCRW